MLFTTNPWGDISFSSGYLVRPKQIQLFQRAPTRQKKSTLPSVPRSYSPLLFPKPRSSRRLWSAADPRLLLRLKVFGTVTGTARCSALRGGLTLCFSGAREMIHNSKGSGQGRGRQGLWEGGRDIRWSHSLTLVPLRQWGWYTYIKTSFKTCKHYPRAN